MRYSICVLLFLLPIFLTLSYSECYGQRSEVYSLLKDASRTSKKEDKAFLTLKAGSLMGRVNPDSALLIMDQALGISRSIKSDSLITLSLYALADYNLKIGNLKVADQYCDTLLVHASESKTSYALALSNYISGIVHAQQGLILTSIEELHKALNIQRERNDTIASAMSLVCLGNVYFQDEQKESAVFYYKKAVKIQLEIPDSLGAASTLVNLASVYILMNKIDSGTYYNDLAYSIISNFDNGEELLFENYMNDAILKLRSGQISNAERALKKGSLIAQKQGAIFKLARALETSATIENEKGNLSLAIQQMKQSVEYFEQIGHLPLLKTAYRGMYELYDKTNNTSEALRMLKKFKDVSDSLYTSQVSARVNDLNIRYETEEKEKKIAENEFKLAQKETELKLLYVVVITSIIITVLMGILYIQLKRVQRQRAENERKERDIALLRALMTGEEKERNRIARELHDGLGGILAASQMELSNIDRSVMPETSQISKAAELIARASDETRRIAHNLLPETLVRIGLENALREYCLSINESKLVSIEFETLGLSKLSPPTELAIYRIVQELINNIIKHSKATQAFIQLHQHDRTLSITIEDNGKGFETDNARRDGIGLSNIKSRINYLNGSINIKSEKDKGTSVYIEVILEKNKQYE